MKKDLTGCQFGSWTVLRLGEPQHDHERWWCRCACGREKQVRTTKLKSEQSKSCTPCSNSKNPRGAAAMRGQTHSRKDAGRSGLRRLFLRYGADARKHDREFTLTKEEFEVITSANCSYCGSPPSRRARNFSPRQSEEGTQRSTYIYNGIDRVDSNGGYTQDNVVSCCMTCNRGKSNMPVDEFKDWIRRSYEFLFNPKIPQA